MTDSPRYATYLRDSGGEDQDLSVEQQEKEIRAWCIQKGHILTRVFKDEARPGSSTVSREAFQDMMRHFRSGDCQEQGVIIWKFSRFARDIDDAQFYKADLRRRGYVILSMKDQVPDGLDGRFFEAAIDWMNNRFLEDLSTDVKRGQRHLLEQYGAIGGTPPRGFKREPVHIADRRDGRPHIVHRWVPDPDLADTIRLAWKMRAEGDSYHKINTATRLYGSLNSYRTFFCNRLYIGELVVSGTVIEDYCDPIIDRETWNAVQHINTKRARYDHIRTGAKNHPSRGNSSFLLSGLAFCAQCGAPLNGEAVAFRQNSKHYQYYACSRSQRHAGCAARKVPKETLENAVIDTLREYILRPENLSAIQSQIRQQSTGEDEHLKTQKRVQERALAHIRKKINNLSDLLAAQGSQASRSLLKKLAELEQDETAALTEIARLNNRSGAIAPDLTEQDIETLANRANRLLTEINPENLREILSGLVERVTAERDSDIIRGMVYYFYPPIDKKKPLCPHDESPWGHNNAGIKITVLQHPFHTLHQRKPRR